jgi:hypothetical protein
MAACENAEMSSPQIIVQAANDTLGPWLGLAGVVLGSAVTGIAQWQRDRSARHMRAAKDQVALRDELGRRTTEVAVYGQAVVTYTSIVGAVALDDALRLMQTVAQQVERVALAADRLGQIGDTTREERTQQLTAAAIQIVSCGLSLLAVQPNLWNSSKAQENLKNALGAFSMLMSQPSAGRPAR